MNYRLSIAKTPSGYWQTQLVAKNGKAVFTADSYTKDKSKALRSAQAFVNSMETANTLAHMLVQVFVNKDKKPLREDHATHREDWIFSSRAEASYVGTETLPLVRKRKTRASETPSAYCGRI